MPAAGPPVEPRFIQSRHLVVHWDGQVPRVYNYATGSNALISSSAYVVLDLYRAWRTASEAAQRCRMLSHEEVASLTEALSDEGFLLRSDRPPAPAEATMDQLGRWNPAAGFFHSATRDVRFASRERARAVQRAAAETTPWPGPFIPEHVALTRLPPPEQSTPVAEAFLERRSWRQFEPLPLPLRSLSSLLWLTGGVQQWVRTRVGEFALKTSPSGGSLHPVELYVLVRKVRTLKPGFYHYAGADHTLRLLTPHTREVSIEQYLPEQPWFELSAAVVFFAAHYDRCLWRYQYPRAYRAPFIEAGHLAQTWCVRATEMGLAPFVSMALADSPIEKEIRADGITRAVLYAAGVGHRPRGAKWAPLPSGDAPLPRRRNRIRRPLVSE